MSNDVKQPSMRWPRCLQSQRCCSRAHPGHHWEPSKAGAAPPAAFCTGHLRDGEEQTDVGWVKLLVFGRMYGEGGVDVEEVKRGEKHC